MRSWKTVAPTWICVGIFACLALANELRDFDLWRNYALSGVAMGSVTAWLLWRYDVRLPHYIQWIIGAATLTHYGGGSLGSPDPYHMGLLGMHGINGAYHHFEWWDHLTHGVGIGASAMGIGYLFEVYQTRRGLQWSGPGVWVVTLVTSLTLGVFVELYEYLGKTAFQTIDQGGYENTMRDLHFNLVGAATGGGLAVTVNRLQFQKRIAQYWQLPDAERTSRDAPWWNRATSGMVGFLVFVSLPALAALALATQFFAVELPPDDSHLYDPALQVLTWTSFAAIALGFAATALHRKKVEALLV